MIAIRQYNKDLFKDLKTLFAELQTFEKEIYSERAAPTKEFMDNLSSELLSDVNSRQGKILMAYEGETPVGFVAGFVEHDAENDSDYFRIDSLIVTEKYRGIGVGKVLISEIEKYAKSIRQTKIGLGVLVGNSAYNYYKKLGFKDYGIEMLKGLK